MAASALSRARAVSSTRSAMSGRSSPFLRYGERRELKDALTSAVWVRPAEATARALFLRSVTCLEGMARKIGGVGCRSKAYGGDARQGAPFAERGSRGRRVQPGAG